MQVTTEVRELTGVSGESVWVVMPDARITDHFCPHPLLLIYPEDDPKVSLRRIGEAVERTPAVIDESPNPSTPPASSPAVSKLPAHLISMSGPKPVPAAPKSVTRGPQEATPRPAPVVAADPVVDTVSMAPTVGPTPAHTLFGLADIEAVVARVEARTLEEQLGGPSDDLARELSRVDTAEQQLAEALQRISRLGAEARSTATTATSGWPTVYGDREQQLRWELTNTWLATVPEQKRGELPTWTLDSKVLDGPELQVIPRAKTIEVMIAILQGDWQDRFGGHQAKESEGGRTKVSPDCTPVWPTYIKEHTPQAPRLIWWHTRSGGVHFHHIGGHDDWL